MFQGGLGGRAIVARADRGINTPADLKGKTIQAKRKSLADLEAFHAGADARLRHPGIGGEDPPARQYQRTARVPQAGGGGRRCDALRSPKTSSPPLRRLAHTIPLKVIAIPADKAAEILQGPAPQGLPAGQDQQGLHQGPGCRRGLPGRGHLCSHPADLSEDVIYAVTKAFFENLKLFYPVHASAKDYTLKGSLAVLPSLSSRRRPLLQGDRGLDGSVGEDPAGAARQSVIRPVRASVPMSERRHRCPAHEP